MKIHELNKENGLKYIDEIVAIHTLSFQGFFLTNLGKGFLKTLYKGYLEDETSGIIIATDRNERAVGFIAYSKEYSDFYKGLLRKHLIEFAFYSIIAVIHHPFFLRRILSAFGKSDAVIRKEKYVELASIGVEINLKGKGIGTELITYMKEKIDFTGYSYITLETDSLNNELANIFYVKNGFVLQNEYTTREGRKMNEYRFLL